MIRFKCPQCGGVLESPESNSGAEINCLGCGSRVQIPPPTDDYFRFPCPSCGKRLKAKTRDTGKKTSCIKCGTSFVVPVAAPPKPIRSTAELRDPHEQNLTRNNGPMTEEEIPWVVPTPDDGVIEFECFKCGEELEIGSRMAGQRVRCVECEALVRVPDPTPRRQVQSNSKACPFCDEQISAGAIKCKHCGESLDPSLAFKKRKRRSYARSAIAAGFVVLIIGIVIIIGALSHNPHMSLDKALMSGPDHWVLKPWAFYGALFFGVILALAGVLNIIYGFVLLNKA